MAIGVASIATSGASLKETVTVILVRGRARPHRENAREQLCCSMCKARRSVPCQLHLRKVAQSRELHNSLETGHLVPAVDELLTGTAR